MSGFVRDLMARLLEPSGSARIGTPSGTLAAELSAQTLSGCATTGALGAMAALKAALQNDFNAAINLRLVGDSITWGLTVAGIASQTPRGHALSDVRNNLTSPTWANLLRDYLGKSYCTSALIAGAAGVGSYTKTVKVSMDDGRLVQKSKTGTVRSKGMNLNADHIYGNALDLPGNADLNGVEFEFTGDGFTVYYVTLPGNGSYELFVDGVSQGLTSTDAAATFNVQKTHTFAHGTHLIRIENTSASAAVRLSGLTWTKTVTLANDGLIGTDTSEWLPTGSLLPASIAATDDFVFVMLGTNDRASVAVPLTSAKTTNNLRTIANYLTGLGKKVVLMAANSVTQNEGAFYYKQLDVTSAIARLAVELKLDYIDHFRLTDLYRQKALAYLDDGLHPNDVGHALMAKNIINALERAPALATVDSTTYATTSQLVKTQVLTVPVSAVALNKSFQTVSIAWAPLPAAIVGVMLRVKSAAGAYGSYTFTQDPGDEPTTGGAVPATDGGAKAGVDLSAWVVRLLNQSGAANCRLGFVNKTGAAVDVVVELTVSYLA